MAPPTAEPIAEALDHRGRDDRPSTLRWISGLFLRKSTTVGLMAAIGVLAIHLGVARGIYLRSSLAFGSLLPPFLCCELGLWAGSRAHGPGRKFWTLFVLGGLAAWLACGLIQCASIEGASSSPPMIPLFMAGLIVEAIDQIVFGQSDPRHTLNLQYPLGYFFGLLAIMSGSGMLLPLFLRLLVDPPASPDDGRVGTGPRGVVERPNP